MAASTRRVLAFFVGFVMMVGVGAVAVPAEAAAKKKGTLRVTVSAPVGVVAKVVVRGKSRFSVVKPVAAAKRTVSKKVVPGRWQVSANPLQVAGVEYTASVKPTRPVVKPGKVTTVKVTYAGSATPTPTPTPTPTVPTPTPTPTPTVPTPTPTPTPTVPAPTPTPTPTPPTPTPTPTTPGTPPAQVGAAYAGGIYVGTTQDDEGKKYALVASPRDWQFAPYAQDPYTYWDSYCISDGACPNGYRHAPVTSEWDGLANTQDAAVVDADYMIFRKASALSYPNDGGSAWYVPSKNELNLLWQNLGESGLAFSYTENGSTYDVTWLWSSTEGAASFAWCLGVRGSLGGRQEGSFKGDSYNNFGVRPVRRIPL